MLGRSVALAVLFAVELILISIKLDTQNLPRQVGLTGLVGDWGPSLLRAIVAFLTLFVAFSLMSSKVALNRLELAPISWGLLTGHLCAMLAFGWLSYILFGHTSASWQTDLIAAVWLVTGVTAVVLAGMAFIPLKAAVEFVHLSGNVWVIALVTSLVACVIGDLGHNSWRSLVGLTFDSVRMLLRPFISDVISNPATRSIGTRQFQVNIAPACSGFEGAGLMLVFSTAWLWYFRREYRFPQALFIVPIGIVLVWLLNSVRIAALILIGSAGAANIALGGFHSQTGWIAFNAVALGFTLTLHRMPWLSATPPTYSREENAGANATAWYLGPFLTILAAAMLTQAASDGFEWLYPLRFFVAAAALSYFRRKYTVDWKVGWAGPVTGAAVFMLWLGSDFMGSRSKDGIGPALASLPAAARYTWIVFRTVAATVTVPLAEELAFRGFLLRRLVASDFEKVEHAEFTFRAVLVSSLAFGLLHGDRWLAGTAAGIFYAVAFRHRGRIGDAVVAHAVTNGLLAVCVLYSGNWQLL